MKVSPPSVSRLVALLLAIAWFFAGAVAADGRFDKGLLWKIERSGAPPSYLFGTMHSDDPQVVQLAGPVRKAFERAQGLTLEIVLDPEALMSMTTSLMLADGSTLEQHVGPDLYRRTVRALGKQGIPELLVTGMKPWAAAITLMTPPDTTGLVLDHVLYQQALAAGKPVDGLETVAEQMDIFDRLLSPQDQVKLLRETLDQLPQIDTMLEELRKAWLDRDLARLTEINESSMASGDPELAARFNRSVILERNHRMAERLRSRLRRGNWFIAVGALHLPGKEGLLNLLSEQGYRVTRVY